MYIITLPTPLSSYISLSTRVKLTHTTELRNITNEMALPLSEHSRCIREGYAKAFILNNIQTNREKTEYIFND